MKRMKLGRKNLVYSMVLAGALLLFLVGYFMYMLPSLYVDYVMEQNLKSVHRQHEAYVKNGTYEGVQVKNAAACFSVKLPKEGNSFFLTGKAFSVEITLKDERLIGLLEEIRENMQNYEKAAGEEKNNDSADWKEEAQSLEATIKELLGEGEELPIDIRFLYVQDMDEGYTNETVKIHAYSESLMIMEAGVEAEGNKYTNYIAMEQTEDGLILSFLPVVTPEMSEIRPIVLQSLPMLGAVIILMVLLFSQIYSKGIVVPIEELVQHAGQMKCTADFSVPPLSKTWEKREDEVRELADTLDDFYLQIKESYGKLEEKTKSWKKRTKDRRFFCGLLPIN